MLNEETLTTAKENPAETARRSRLGDLLIHGREWLLNQLAGASPSLAINQALVDSVIPPSADLAARLKQTLDDLRFSVMDEMGSNVDYAALRHSQAYADYQEECLAALRHFKPESLPTENARRAFWVNLYNALVLDAVITFGVQGSVTEGRLGILAFFRRAAYVIDGRRVSLEDIEHGILRANRGNPYVLGPHFASDDPRLAWSLPLDPRLHFALNCGGRSCPPIRSYSADKLDAQLDLAARGFVDATVEVKPENNEVLLSRILKWYAKDFGGREGVLKFVIAHLPDDARGDFLIKSGATLGFKYVAYDWGLNSA
jgi:hypothetical protein